MRREEPPKKDEPPKKGILRKLAGHPMAKPLLIAGALHLPIQKDVGDALGRAVEMASDAMKSPWEKRGMVLEPQSREQQAAVAERIAGRERSIDPAARDAYKADAERKLASGDPPSFERMQFDLERLNGVPESEVASAERKADELIEKYATMVGDDLDEDELRRISIELYGPDEAYDWGQASVTRYLNGGERNCVAVSRAQSIVLEGVLARLPAEKRAHWRLVTQLVKQHEVAGIEHLSGDGKRDVLYLLEGKATRERRGAQEEPGTATLPMDVVKKALVSSAPVEVSAAGRPDEIKDSPRLDLVTDEPASLNVRVEGKLKGAEFNEQEARREGLEPREMTEAERAAQAAQEKLLEGQVMEVELLTDPGPEGARRMLENAPFLENVSPWTGTRYRLKFVDAAGLDSPSPETVAALGGVADPATGYGAWRVAFGNMDRWDPAAVRQALRNDLPSVSVRTMAGGRMSGNFLREFAAVGKEGGIGPTNIKIEYGGADQKMEGGAVDPDDLRILLSGEGRRIVDIGGMYIDDFEKLAAVVREMPADKTVVMPKAMNYRAGGKDAYLLFGKTEGKVMMPYDAYGELIAKHPDILDDKHFLFDAVATSAQLETLQKIIEGIRPGHPLLTAIEALKRAHKGMASDGDDEQGHVDPFELLSEDGK
ncbi:MAG: hypothetical protein RL272_56 [Candidatus Parcubacteria bacterium]